MTDDRQADALPSAGYEARLEQALHAWRVRTGRQFSSKWQADLIRIMEARFGESAPSQSAVSKWFTSRKPPAEVDGQYMLAVALGASPSWLYFNEGDEPPMTDGPSAPTSPQRDPEDYRLPLKPLRATVEREQEAEKPSAKKRGGRP